MSQRGLHGFLLVIGIAFLLIISVGSVAAQDGSPPATDWEQVYTDGSGVTEAEAMVQTGDGGYLLAGQYDPDSDDNQQGKAIKLDSEGNVIWNKTYGDAGFDRFYAAERTSDGGYILAGSSDGLSNEQAWLVKIQSDGTKEWEQKYGDFDPTARALSVVETADGGYAFAGWIGATQSGNPNGWLVKTNSDGAKQWDHTYGGDETDKIQTVIETDAGGFALAGGSSSFASDGDDMWLIRTDNTGAKQWDETYSNSNDDGVVGEGLIQTDDSGFALSGFTGGSLDNTWLVKVTNSGTKEWDSTTSGV